MTFYALAGYIIGATAMQAAIWADGSKPALFAVIFAAACVMYWLSGAERRGRERASRR